MLHEENPYDSIQLAVGVLFTYIPYWVKNILPLIKTTSKVP
jgi:hypothetical protein